MRAKKWLSIITLGCSVIALAVVIEKPACGLAYDIALAVFGSALLGFIMSLVEYLIERRHAMEVFWDEARKALAKLRTIKYIDIDAPIDLVRACFQEERSNSFAKLFDSGIKDEAKKALVTWYEENKMMCWTEYDDIDAELEKYYSSKIESYKESFMKCIRSCVEAAGVDLGPLGNAYGNLDFIFGNNSVRKSALNRIYNPVYSFRELLREELYHFNLLLNGQGSLPVCAEKAYSIIQKVFTEEMQTGCGFESKVVYQSLFDDVDKALEDFRCEIYRHIKPDYPKRIPVLGTTEYFDFSDEDSKA